MIFLAIAFNSGDLNPATPLAFVEQVLHFRDIVLVISVNPGSGGQAFLPDAFCRRSASCGAFAWRADTTPWIEVDGGQNDENACQAVEAGADALVAGSAVLGSADYAAAIASLRLHPAPR